MLRAEGVSEAEISRLDGIDRKVNASLRPFVATGIRARTFFALGVDGAAQSRRC